MKKTTLLSGVRQDFTQIKGLFFGAFLLASITAQSQSYCTPEEGDCTDGDEIVNVTFAGLTTLLPAQNLDMEIILPEQQLALLQDNRIIFR
ncbi:hypothetical protein H9W95_08425 [Flavobacterium lindanitolerans]|nr:hypothetical protein [Flavobacterium lindanitolerans]